MSSSTGTTTSLRIYKYRQGNIQVERRQYTDKGIQLKDKMLVPTQEITNIHKKNYKNIQENIRVQPRQQRDKRIYND